MSCEHSSSKTSYRLSLDRVSTLLSKDGARLRIKLTPKMASDKIREEVLVKGDKNAIMATLQPWLEETHEH